MEVSQNGIRTHLPFWPVKGQPTEAHQAQKIVVPWVSSSVRGTILAMWLWLSKPMGAFFWVGAPPILEPILVGIGMFTGRYGILTHGHVAKGRDKTALPAKRPQALTLAGTHSKKGCSEGAE